MYWKREIENIQLTSLFSYRMCQDDFKFISPSQTFIGSSTPMDIIFVYLLIPSSLIPSPLLTIQTSKSGLVKIVVPSRSKNSFAAFHSL